MDHPALIIQKTSRPDFPNNGTFPGGTVVLLTKKPEVSPSWFDKRARRGIK
jgi:hypothetical protein